MYGEYYYLLAAFFYSTTLAKFFRLFPVFPKPLGHPHRFFKESTMTFPPPPIDQIGEFFRIRCSRDVLTTLQIGATLEWSPNRVSREILSSFKPIRPLISYLFKVNGHIESHYRVTDGYWTEPELDQDPFLRIHGLAPAFNYGQQVFEGMRGNCNCRVNNYMKLSYLWRYSISRPGRSDLHIPTKRTRPVHGTLIIIRINSTNTRSAFSENASSWQWHLTQNMPLPIQPTPHYTSDQWSSAPAQTSASPRQMSTYSASTSSPLTLTMEVKHWMLSSWRSLIALRQWGRGRRK